MTQNNRFLLVLSVAVHLLGSIALAQAYNPSPPADSFKNYDEVLAALMSKDLKQIAKASEVAKGFDFKSRWAESASATRLLLTDNDPAIRVVGASAITSSMLRENSTQEELTHSVELAALDNAKEVRDTLQWGVAGNQCNIVNWAKLLESVLKSSFEDAKEYILVDARSCASKLTLEDAKALLPTLRAELYKGNSCPTCPPIEVYSTEMLVTLLKRHPEFSAKLIELLQDRDPRVRALIIHELGAGPWDPAILKIVESSLDDSNLEVRRAAIGALGDLGQNASEYVVRLESQTKSIDPSTRRIAFISLVRIKPSHEPYAAGLKSIYDAGTNIDKIVVAGVIQSLSYSHPEAAPLYVPFLIKLLASGDQSLVGLAVEALRNFGVGSKDALPTLMEVAKSAPWGQVKTRAKDSVKYIEAKLNPELVYTDNSVNAKFEKSQLELSQRLKKDSETLQGLPRVRRENLDLLDQLDKNRPESFYGESAKTICFGTVQIDSEFGGVAYRDSKGYTVEMRPGLRNGPKRRVTDIVLEEPSPTNAERASTDLLRTFTTSKVPAVENKGYSRHSSVVFTSDNLEQFGLDNSEQILHFFESPACTSSDSSLLEAYRARAADKLHLGPACKAFIINGLKPIVQLPESSNPYFGSASSAKIDSQMHAAFAKLLPLKFPGIDTDSSPIAQLKFQQLAELVQIIEGKITIASSRGVIEARVGYYDPKDKNKGLIVANLSIGRQIDLEQDQIRGNFVDSGNIMGDSCIDYEGQPVIVSISQPDDPKRFEEVQLILGKGVTLSIEYANDASSEKIDQLPPSILLDFVRLIDLSQLKSIVQSWKLPTPS